MNRLLLCAGLLLASCHPTQPIKDCPAPDGGTTLDNPCAGKADGTSCCLSGKPGTCHSSECVLK